MKRKLKRVSRGRVTIPVSMVEHLVNGNNARIMAYTPKHGKYLTLTATDHQKGFPSNADIEKPIGYYVPDQDGNIMITGSVLDGNFSKSQQFVCRRNNGQLHLLPA